MKNIFWDFIVSFKNNPDGFSGRKLSAFYAVVIMASFITFKFCSKENAVEMLLVWICFALLCLGIVTVQQIIDFRTGSTTKKEIKIESSEKLSSTTTTDSK